MPQTEKLPIGSRVSGMVDTGRGAKEVAMRVRGYDGLKDVIVEVLEGDPSPWNKVILMPAKDLTLREEVKHTQGEPEDGDGPAIGWIDLGGLSVSLTRDNDGTLLVIMERDPDCEDPVTARVRKMPDGKDVWEGVWS